MTVLFESKQKAEKNQIIYLMPEIFWVEEQKNQNRPIQTLWH